MGDRERGAAGQGSDEGCVVADRGASELHDAAVARRGAGAHTPEDLEMLCEDACVLRDDAALAALFEEGGVLALADQAPARGHRAIAQAARALWADDRLYIAAPRRVVQVRDMALVVAGQAINVLCQGSDGAWRYVIALHASDTPVVSGITRTGGRTGDTTPTPARPTLVAAEGEHA